MESQITFLPLCKALLLRPRSFFEKHITKENKRPYFRVVLGVSFTYLAVIIFFALKEELRLKEELSVDFSRSNGWVVLLLLLALGTLIPACLYLVSGWSAKIFIFLSGGEATVSQARTIELYNAAMSVVLSLPLLLAGLLLLHLTNTMGWVTFHHLVTVSSWPTSLWSIYGRYNAIMALTGAKKGLTVFWVIIIPLVFVMLSMLKELGIVAIPWF